MTTILTMLVTISAAAPDSPFGLPLWLGVIVMFGIVVARAQLTYWVGRAAGTGFSRSRWAERIGRDRIARAEATVAHYGPVAVTLSFLTIGVQTAVNFIAGTTRMPFARYLVAMLAGSALWAVIWTVGGLGIIWAWLTVFTHAPVVAVAVLVGLATLIVVIVVRRGNRTPAADVEAASLTEQENR